MKYAELTERIINCALKVHNTLGSGFQELIYQRALAIEFRNAGLSVQREMDMPIIYHDVQIGTRRLDFFIEGKIMLEIKAIAKLDDLHLAQALNYLEAYDMEVGLLINLGSRSMEIKRVHNNKKININR